MSTRHGKICHFKAGWKKIKKAKLQRIVLPQYAVEMPNPFRRNYAVDVTRTRYTGYSPEMIKLRNALGIIFLGALFLWAVGGFQK